MSWEVLCEATNVDLIKFLLKVMIEIVYRLRFILGLSSTLVLFLLIRQLRLDNRSHCEKLQSNRLPKLD